MNYREIINSIAAVGNGVAGLVPEVARLADVAANVIVLIDKIGDAIELPQADIETLRATREKLEASVNTHADQTIDRLRGK